MDTNQIIDLSHIVAAIAVIISLIYLAIQVRRIEEIYSLSTEELGNLWLKHLRED